MLTNRSIGLMRLYKITLYFLKRSWQERKGFGKQPMITATGQISGRKPVIPATGQIPGPGIGTITSVRPVQSTYPVRTVQYVTVPQTVETVHRVRGPYVIRGVAPTPKPRVALVAVKTFRDGNVPGKKKLLQFPCVCHFEMTKNPSDNGSSFAFAFDRCEQVFV